MNREFLGANVSMYQSAQLSVFRLPNFKSSRSILKHLIVIVIIECSVCYLIARSVRCKKKKKKKGQTNRSE